MGQKAVRTFESAVPRTWDIKTGEINQEPAAWARSPNRAWQFELKPSTAPGDDYFLELHTLRRVGQAGLHDGAKVRDAAEVRDKVRAFLHDIASIGDGPRKRGKRIGEVDDSAGLFDQLG